MERWFDKFYDCQSFGYRPKTEIVRHLIKQYEGPFVVVGDRNTDLACAKEIHAPFIGCLYGYGTKEELRGADVLLERPEGLSSAVVFLLENS